MLVFVVGLVLAGGAAYYVFAKVQAAQAAVRPAESVPTVMVAVAARPLKFGMPIGKEHVRLVRWPAESAPKNAFGRVEDLFQEEGEIRTVLRRMEPGEPILKSKVSGFGQQATVAALIEKGMRAYTLPVDAATSVGGFLLPGARIDVFLTIPDRVKGPTTRLLIQDLEVVAVDQDTDPDRIEARVAKTVTVQGTPEQVRELTLATTLGAISIALRGYDSGQVADVGPLDRRTLLGEPEPKPEAPAEVVVEAPEPETKVTVRRGNEVEVKTLP